jgi:MFS family permease
MYYGWVIVAVACFCYGFGISPAYYSWGQFFKQVELELGYSRSDLGWMFGIFTFLYSAVSPLTGMLQNRFGIRNVMVSGSLLAAAGFLVTSQTHGKLGFLIGFSIMGGLGIGLSTIIPCQTLGQNWFLKRRALALALILSAGGAVAPLVTRADGWIMGTGEGGWRTGWLIVAGCSVFVAMVAFFFVRDNPEDMGLHRDNLDHDPEVAAETNGEAQWTAMEALKTKQFFFMVLAGIAYAVPWGVVISQGSRHLDDVGVAAGVMGMVGVFSIGGRLSSILGDKISPQLIAAVALVLEGIGVAGFYFVRDETFAYTCLFLIGLGFGATYVAIPQIFSDFFGRKAFATTAGVRILITGVFNGLGPWITGLFYDELGSYFIPFMALSVICFIGAVASALSKHPGTPKKPAEEVEMQEAA